MAFSWKQFNSECPNYYSVWWVWNYSFKITAISPRGHGVELLRILQFIFCLAQIIFFYPSTTYFYYTLTLSSTCIYLTTITQQEIDRSRDRLANCFLAVTWYHIAWDQAWYTIWLTAGIGSRGIPCIIVGNWSECQRIARILVIRTSRCEMENNNV